MDLKTQRAIQAKLRQLWSWSDDKKQIKLAARTQMEKGQFKNGKVIMRVYYKCAHCKENHKAENIQVDHIEMVGPFTGSWDDYIGRLFCDKSNLQILCAECHNVKTNEDKKKCREINKKLKV